MKTSELFVALEAGKTIERVGLTGIKTFIKYNFETKDFDRSANWTDDEENLPRTKDLLEDICTEPENWTIKIL